MVEQLDFVSQPSGDVAADVEYTRALAQSARSQLKLGTPVGGMVRLTSDAPELLLTEHLEGAQAILIFGWRI
jgi:hypothetical protein